MKFINTLFFRTVLILCFRVINAPQTIMSRTVYNAAGLRTPAIERLAATSTIGRVKRNRTKYSSGLITMNGHASIVHATPIDRALSFIISSAMAAADADTMIALTILLPP